MLGTAFADAHDGVVYPEHPDLPDVPRQTSDDVWLPVIGARRLVVRFGWTRRRREFLDGLAEAVELLAVAGCSRIWLNGSFVTSKDEPGDFDACWDTGGVDLDILDAVFFDFESGRARQKERFGGELFPKLAEAATSGLVFTDFFQNDATVAARASSP